MYLTYISHSLIGTIIALTIEKVFFFDLSSNIFSNTIMKLVKTNDLLCDHPLNFKTSWSPEKTDHYSYLFRQQIRYWLLVVDSLNNTKTIRISKVT